MWTIISTLRFIGRISNVTILSVYAPIRDSPDGAKNWFYLELQKMIDSVPECNILFVTGDFNTRVGNLNTNTKGVIRRHIMRDRCSNGERLLQLAKYSNLCLVNTQFEIEKNHFVTWRSIDGVTKAQINQFLVKRRWKSSGLDVRA